MPKYTIEKSNCDDDFYNLVDERNIIVAGSWSLEELMNHLEAGDVIVKGESMPVIAMNDGYDDTDDDYWDDPELLAMEAQAEYSERTKWY